MLFNHRGFKPPPKG